MAATELAWQNYLRRVPLGWVAGEDGFRYRITWEDAMWMIRAVVGESGVCDDCQTDGRAVVWTMINRLYYLRNSLLRRRGTTPSNPPHKLADVTMWYCQPINPYWRYREPNAARRQRISSLGPGDVNRTTINNVLRVLTGRSDNRPFVGLIDFAACDCEGCGRDRHGPEDLQLINCFWSSSETSRWNANTVRVLPGYPRASSRPSMAASASLLVGGVSAVFYWLVPTSRRT